MALAARARTVGSAPAPTAPAKELVNTVELLRGRVYWYKDKEFKKGDIEVVTDELAAILEVLHQEVTDKEGELYEKPFFEVKRKVPRPDPKPVLAKRKQIRRLPAR